MNDQFGPDFDIVDLTARAASAIVRLDVRVSLSPLREAWDVRASARAAITLAGIDGRPVREVDLVALMAGADLPVASSHLGAGVALAWWQRVLGRVDLGEATSRLIGRTMTPARRAAEDQAEWDDEDAISPAARRALGDRMALVPGDVDVDGWAETGRLRALEAMRAAGDRLVDLPAGLRDALSVDRDPERHPRVHDLAGIVTAQAEARLAVDVVGLDPEAAAARRDAVASMLSSLDWEAPRGLGEAHMAVADRLVETGLCSRRLSILTGATKRVAVEGRGDARAVAGFLRVLECEARDGLVLLAALEAMVARWSRTPGLSSNSRSSLPDVLWAVLALPVVDAGWIGEACGLEARVVQKFVRRLADAGMIEPWADRTAEGLTRRGASLRLWVAAGFADDLSRRASRAIAKPHAPVAFGTVMERSAVRGGFAPMAEVFARFDAEMVEIGEAYGSLWPVR